MRYPIVSLFVVLAFSCSRADCAEPETKSQYKVPTQWAGSWEISPEANKLLGFAGEDDRKNADFSHPRSFTLSFDKTIGESVSAEYFQGYRDHVFTEKFGHRIVATGAWKMKLEVDPGFKEDGFFLTVKEGNTYLWKPAAYVVLYGGKISFIEGVDKNHDLLAIDFNPQDSKFPWHEAVVYKRTQQQPENKTSKAESHRGSSPSERIQSVRKSYRAVPPDILGVKEPVKVLWSDVLFDGGTMFLDAEDADGVKIRVYLRYDQEYHELESEDNWERNYQTRPIEIEIGKTRQALKQQQHFPIRGPEEAAIYGLLIRWSEKPNYEPVGGLQNYQKHWTELFLNAMDYRFAKLPDAKD